MTRCNIYVNAQHPDYFKQQRTAYIQEIHSHKGQWQEPILDSTVHGVHI